MCYEDSFYFVQSKTSDVKRAGKEAKLEHEAKKQTKKRKH